MNCPHCQSPLLWSEDRGPHCDGCGDFDESSLAPAQGSDARPTCGCCGERETVITRVPPLMVAGLNALCGIGEEWECPNCGHIWEKQKHQNS